MKTSAWLLGSNNKKKSEEISAILSAFGVELVTLKGAGLAMDVDEWGENFAQNAALKALQFSAAFGGVAVADDSGLSVVGLGGAPGVISARFAGENATDAQNNEKLQEELRARPHVSRAASYHCMIAVAAGVDSSDPLIARLRQNRPTRELEAFESLDSEGAYRISSELNQRLASSNTPMELWLFDGRWSGVIADLPKGEGGFGYDPWFALADGRHVAELPDAEKNQMSHRAEGLRKLTAALSV